MESSFINPFDAGVLIILILSGVISLSKGFVTEALSLGAYVGAIFLTLQGHPFVAPYVHDLVKPELIADVITYALIGIVSLAALKFLASFLGGMVKDSHIGALDRAMGVLFGLARGIFLISFIYLITTPFISKNNYPDWYQDAKSRPLVEYGASMLNAINPYKDDIDFDETRKDIEALERLKRMAPSFPSGSKDEAKYDNKSRDEMNDLAEKYSKE